MAIASRTPTMEMKRFNRNRIFRYILKSEVTSNPDIAYDLKLSLPTVTQNTRELIEKGLVREAGKLESTGGKRATALSAVADYRCAVGLDITRNHVSLVLTDMRGALRQGERVFQPYRHDGEYYQRVNALLEGFLDRCGVDRETVLGVGVSVPGIVDLEREVVQSHVLRVDSVPFGQIAGFFAYPCRFLNDANAGAYAEGVRHESLDRFFYLSLSTTVGGAIYENGELIQGKAHRCGEVGHMTIELDGAPCYCGKRGCMDVYCSAERLAELAEGSLEGFFQRLERGDAECAEAWNRYVSNLVVALDNIHMVLDCDIVLGGYVGGHIERYLGEIRQRAEARGIFRDEETFVLPCHFRYEAAAMGAALSVMEDYIGAV